MHASSSCSRAATAAFLLFGKAPAAKIPCRGDSQRSLGFGLVNPPINRGQPKIRASQSSFPQSINSRTWLRQFHSVWSTAFGNSCDRDQTNLNAIPLPGAGLFNSASVRCDFKSGKIVRELSRELIANGLTGQLG
jgi:hypothetical protein